MAFRDRYEKKKALLGRQHTQQIKNKDSRNSFPSIIRKDKLPPGVEVWKCDSEDHLIEILPSFAGPDFPLDPVTKTQIIEEDDPVYVLDLMVHKNIGSSKMPFVCPNENYGLPCPICEFMGENRLEKEDWKAVRTRRQTVYLIWVRDTRDTEKKGIQIWEVAHFIMEEKLNVISKQPRGGGAIKFSDPDEGQSVAFTKQGKGDKVQYLGHRLVQREDPIPEKLLDGITFSLDSVVDLHPTYEEIEKAFHGQKGKLSNEGDIDKAGSSFSDSGNGRTDDDVPDWMKDPEPPKKEEKKTQVSPKPKGKLIMPKRNLVIRK